MKYNYPLYKIYSFLANKKNIKGLLNLTKLYIFIIEGLPAIFYNWRWLYIYA